jgi:hypothetical protein
VGRVAILALCVGLGAGCRGGGTAVGPAPEEEGIWILDSAFTLDEFPFDSAACAEVYPAGSVNIESVPTGSIADLRVRATACYHAIVRVVGPDSDTVRTFDVRFGIFNRSEGQKNRGVVGFSAWDGKADGGEPAPPGDYLWRMEFDFGAGRFRWFRTMFSVP